MPHNSTITQGLDSFDIKQRMTTLAGLIRNGIANKSISEKIVNGASCAVNMHLHSFYSYNRLGYSPAHLGLECRRNGLSAAGLCDFDVLDGLEEFITAGEILELRVAVHLETRAFLKEYARDEINSPGEPGVTYIMGAGFGRLPPDNSGASRQLEGFRQQANRRNRELVKRINTSLPDLAIDYDSKVLPMSPGGCPTERHIIKAYRLKAQELFADKTKLAKYWAELFQKPLDETELLIGNTVAMEEKMRSVLAKRGGVGYVQPDEKTFPLVDDFIAWVLSCNAIPMVTWLDGTSRGEDNMEQMLECLRSKGAAALNIIPDRNHNIKNPDERRLKLKKFAEVVNAARKLKFPINIGTEMNKAGQPLFDDLECEALSPYKADFLRGANIMVGQTGLARYAGFSYCGQAAESEFGNDLNGKNSFFEVVGKLPPINSATAGRLKEMGFEKAFRYLRDSAGKEKWL